MRICLFALFSLTAADDVDVLRAVFTSDGANRVIRSLREKQTWLDSDEAALTDLLTYNYNELEGALRTLTRNVDDAIASAVVVAVAIRYDECLQRPFCKYVPAVFRENTERLFIRFLSPLRVEFSTSTDINVATISSTLTTGFDTNLQELLPMDDAVFTFVSRDLLRIDAGGQRAYVDTRTGACALSSPDMFIVGGFARVVSLYHEDHMQVWSSGYHHVMSAQPQIPHKFKIVNEGRNVVSLNPPRIFRLHDSVDITQHEALDEFRRYDGDTLSEINQQIGAHQSGQYRCNSHFPRHQLHEGTHSWVLDSYVHTNVFEEFLWSVNTLNEQGRFRLPQGTHPRQLELKAIMEAIHTIHASEPEIPEQPDRLQDPERRIYDLYASVKPLILKFMLGRVAHGIYIPDARYGSVITALIEATIEAAVLDV